VVICSTIVIPDIIQPWEGSDVYMTTFLSSVHSPSEHEGHFQGSVENLARIIAEGYIAMLFHYFTL